MILPPMLALAGQMFVGWNSDRTKERRFHAVVPIALGALALAVAPLTQGQGQGQASLRERSHG